MDMPSSQKSPDLVAVIGSQYCAPYPIGLTITKKAISLSGGDFTVTDRDSGVLFKVKGTLLSLRDERVLFDATGQPLVTMQKKILTMHNKWLIYRGDSTDAKDLLFTVKKSSIIQLKTELDVFLAASASEHACDFKIKGSFFKKSCTICVGGSNAIIAQMSRKYKFVNLVSGKDTIGVTVYPNVDCAFIVALIVILNEVADSAQRHSTQHTRTSQINRGGM